MVIAGVVQIATRGLPLGIDFAGGTNVIVKFERRVSEDQVRQAIAPVAKENVVQQFGEAADNEVLIKLPQTQDAEKGTSLEQGARQVVERDAESGLPKFEVIGTEIVGPVIAPSCSAGDLRDDRIDRRDRHLIAMRFRPRSPSAAIAATLHDVRQPWPS